MADLQDRRDIEASFAAKLSRLSSRHRRELVDLLGDPPDLANVPRDFWDRVQKETEEELAAMMLLIFASSAIQHGLDRERATEQAERFASSRSSDVAGQYVQNRQEEIARATIDWRERVNKGEAILKREVEDRTSRSFGPRKAAQIAVNETTNAAVDGGEAGVRETVGFDEDDTWFTVNDQRVCPICEPLHRSKRSNWTSKFPTGPPAHVGCRCWIHYANEKRGAAAIGG